MLSGADRARVAQAVEAAEAHTSAEIVCVLGQEVSAYAEVPLAWGAAAALVLPPLALLAWSYYGHAGGWSTGARAEGLPLALIVSAYTAAQGGAFALVAGLVAIPAVRRRLTPGSLKTHRVRRLAHQQFLATGLPTDPERHGLLIFASVHDRRVELVADETTHQAVGEAAWTAAVDAISAGMRRGEPAAGFERAAALCGEALARAFPADAHDNRFADGLIEI